MEDLKTPSPVDEEIIGGDKPLRTYVKGKI
jgi:hypothetical protein